MINKVYEKYIKNNIKYITIYVFIFLFVCTPLPYYIEMPGGTTDINNKIEIENSYKSKGMFGFAYVSSLRATPLLYIISIFNSNWDIIPIKDIKLDNETIKDLNFRDNLLMEESFDNASIVAFKKAGKPLDITENNLYITYIAPYSKTNVNIKDQIISIDNIKVNNINEIKKIIKNKNKVNIEVIRNNKTYHKYAEIIKIDNKKSIGIMVTNDIKFTSKPKITFKKEANESGSSGGLMLALTIYNNLVKEDITKGKKIIGTGTIDINGYVGEIGGISYKIKGAVKDNADIFLVPSANYKEALKTIKDNNYNLELVKINTFNDALNYLNAL